MDFHYIINNIWKHLVAWFILFEIIVGIWNFSVYYYDPTYGFNSFGPIVYLTLIFPCIWLCFYLLGNRKANHTLKKSQSVKEKEPTEEA